MVNFYFNIIFVFNFLKPSHHENFDIWVLSEDNILITGKDLYVLNPPPIEQSSNDHLNNVYERTDYNSSENSDEMGGINYDIQTKIQRNRGSERYKVNKIYGYGMDKIVGGVEVDNYLYPYHVAYGSDCGGAIIAHKWVMTAGHCGHKPYVRVGSIYMNSGIKVAVKANHIHPKWPDRLKAHLFDYDYQLLELRKHLKYSDSVQPIKIGDLNDMVIGNVITVTGWGHTYENGDYSSVLRAVRVPIISKETCQSVPFPYFRGSLTSRMFCAGYAQGMKDACQGDSGGPAVAGDRLLGIVSFGYGCATPGAYGVYSKVAKVRDWIEQTTGIMFD